MDSNRNRPAVISIGEVLWDLFPEGARFGGAPANFACHAANLGAGVNMVSAVGDDARGHEAIENILRRACELAADVRSQPGAVPALLTR